MNLIKISLWTENRAITGKKVMALLMLSALFSLTACDSTEDAALTDVEQLQSQLEHEKKLIKISTPYTPENNPQLYDQWRPKWVKVVNTMRLLAGKHVYDQPECDEVISIDLSKDSEINKQPILDVQCLNQTVFAVSLTDIRQKRRVYPQRKLFGKTMQDFTQACIKTLKPFLMYPNSLRYDEAKTTADLEEGEKELKLTIPITIKTGFGSDISHIMDCRATDDFNVFVQLNPAPKPTPNSKNKAKTYTKKE